MGSEVGVLQVGTVSIDGTKVGANAVLEERARAKAAAQQQAYEAKVKARNKRRGRRKGCRIKPPSQEPQRTDQVNLTDEDSRLMRASKSSAYIHGHNAQAVVDAEGSQMVLGARVSTCASDRNELLADLETIPKQVGEPTTILVDSGYENMEQIEQVQKPGGLKKRRRQAMAKRMASKPARRIFRKRQQTVEPVFGIIKEVLGFGRFHLRALPKVESEWKLVCLIYNLKRLFKLIDNELAIMIA